MNYLSLFSGIGGFEYGIQKSNKNDMLNCIGYSETNKYATSIYKKHFNHKELGDVKKIKTDKLPKFELLVGGFPCQSFSNSGRKQGFCEPNGNLFFEIERILKYRRPKYFLLENVRGLLSNKSGETFKTILQVFTSLGYDVEWELYNSENFGVPQRRERLFIKGYFRGKCGGEILSFRKKSTRPNYFIKENNYPIKYKIKETTKKGYKEARLFDGVLYSRTNRKLMRGMVQENKTGTISTGNNWGVVDKTGRIRRLTPLESERLQGFPDHWTKYGVNDELISDNQRYKCIGNAVTTNVVKYIFDNWELIE